MRFDNHWSQNNFDRFLSISDADEKILGESAALHFRSGARVQDNSQDKHQFL
jgi:hypothetical protein